MSEVVVGLDVHLKNTQVTVMKLNGEIIKRERVQASKQKRTEKMPRISS